MWCVVRCALCVVRCALCVVQLQTIFSYISVYLNEVCWYSFTCQRSRWLPTKFLAFFIEDSLNSAVKLVVGWALLQDIGCPTSQLCTRYPPFRPNYCSLFRGALNQSRIGVVPIDWHLRWSIWKTIMPVFLISFDLNSIHLQVLSFFFAWLSVYFLVKSRRPILPLWTRD